MFRTRGLAVLLAVASCASFPLAADDNAEKLHALRQRIDALQQRLEANLGARDRVRAQLRDAERDVGEVLRKLHGIDRALRSEETRLADLNAQATRRRRHMQGEIDALGAELRAAQIMGRQDYLKLLLSQDDTARVARTLVYYRYLAAARARRIQHVQQGLAQLRTVQQQVEQRRQGLAALRATQAQAQARLQGAQRERAAVLARLDRSIESHSQEIERLRREERGLTQLIDGLRRLTPERDVPIGPQARFAELKGRLPMPVSVRVRTARTIGGRKGVVLPVAPGQPVHAVFRGRVAYSDWLPGFGLLLILEHGNGYMTLYGYNQSLYKSVGDWVEAGQIIAMSGNTGGAHRPGLYFEVRHNGEARNPLDWFRR